MKVTGYCNLFVKKVEKDGKVFAFPEVSISSKDAQGKFASITVPASFSKDLVDVEDLKENMCYNIDVKDSFLNIQYDAFKKCNIFKLLIIDFEFQKTTEFNKNKPAPKKKLPK